MKFCKVLKYGNFPQKVDLVEGSQTFSGQSEEAISPNYTEYTPSQTRAYEMMKSHHITTYIVRPTNDIHVQFVSYLTSRRSASNEAKIADIESIQVYVL